MFAHHVAVRSEGVLWVAVTGLAATILSVVPVVWSTLVTVVASHVLLAEAGSGLPVTVTLSVTAGGLDSASSHTGTT